MAVSLAFPWHFFGVYCPQGWAFVPFLARAVGQADLAG
jgi:hypothetical protein